MEGNARYGAGLIQKMEGKCSVWCRICSEYGSVQSVLEGTDQISVVSIQIPVGHNRNAEGYKQIEAGTSLYFGYPALGKSLHTSRSGMC